MSKREKRLPSYMTDNVSDDLIRLVDMVKIYDTGSIKVLGLKRINLTIKRGEFVAIIGLSGAGKSTLMSVLFGLYQPEKGIIKVRGREVKIKGPLDANALGLAHNPIDFMHLTRESHARLAAALAERIPTLF